MWEESRRDTWYGDPGGGGGSKRNGWLGGCCLLSVGLHSEVIMYDMLVPVWGREQMEGLGQYDEGWRGQMGWAWG